MKPDNQFFATDYRGFSRKKPEKNPCNPRHPLQKILSSHLSELKSEHQIPGCIAGVELLY